MRLTHFPVVAFAVLLLSGCSPEKKDPPPGAKEPALQSAFTPLSGPECRKEIDRADPNETPFLVCPGVAGYSVAVRRAGSGQRSIDVIDPKQNAAPLNYHETVIRHMFSLGDKAEWRVASRDGKQVPVALVVRVLAREDTANPEKITRTVLAVAKITPAETCVTDAAPASGQSENAVRGLADSALERKCAAPQPPLVR